MNMCISCKRRPRALLLWLILTYAPACVRSQSPSDLFAPGAAAVGSGHTGVVGIYDATALHWNPSALAVRRFPQATLALHQAYAVNYLGYSHFVPRIGAFGVSFSSADAENPLKSAGIGWAFSPAAGLYVGASLAALTQSHEQWTGLGIGALFKPTVSRFRPISKGSMFRSPLLRDRLAVGLGFYNLPFGRPTEDSLSTGHFAQHQIRFGLSYRLFRAGPTLVYAHHFLPIQDTDHLGVQYSPHKNILLYAGCRNFAVNQLGLGGEFLWQNVVFQLAYDAGVERLVFTTSVRLGPLPHAAAAAHYDKAKEALRRKDKRAAVRHAETALAFNENHQKAISLHRLLTPVLRAEEVKIDSMLYWAHDYESQGRFMNAAAQYLKILKLDPNNRKARAALDVLRPKVSVDADRWYLAGVKLYEQNDIKGAQELFESILLVKPDHFASQNYLNKIQDYYRKKAEAHYFAGLGYYSQRKLDLAEREFAAALDIIPEYQDAPTYLDRIRQEKARNQGYISNLLSDAYAKERSGALKSALARYQEVLAVQPDHPYALDKTAELKRKLEEYITANFERGVRAFQNGDAAQARSAFATVLNMEPNHAGAKQYLAQLTAANDRSSTIERAQQLYDAGNYEAAAALADSALKANPHSEQAFVIRTRALDAMDADKLLISARRDYEQGQYLAAMESLEKLLKQDPRRLDALELREACKNGLNERVDDYFNRGIRLYTEEKYEEAVKMWDVVLRINPAHKGALDYRDKALERLEALQSLP